MRAFEIDGWDTGAKIRRDSWCLEEYIEYINKVQVWRWRNSATYFPERELLKCDDWELYEEAPQWYIHTYWGVDLGNGRCRIETLTDKPWEYLDTLHRIFISTIKCDKNGIPL